ncbi:MAG TPA: sigma factor [Blastocatellia bacterium]|nr:sigma factor [Blastocatellia bacterium]
MTLTEVFETYHGRLLLVATSILGNKDEAEDCLQDLYLKLHRTDALRRFEQRAQLYTWLYRCVLNQANDRCARRHRRMRILISRGVPEPVAARMV